MKQPVNPVTPVSVLVSVWMSSDTMLTPEDYKGWHTHLSIEEVQTHFISTVRANKSIFILKDKSKRKSLYISNSPGNINGYEELDSGGITKFLKGWNNIHVCVKNTKCLNPSYIESSL